MIKLFRDVKTTKDLSKIIDKFNCKVTFWHGRKFYYSKDQQISFHQLVSEVGQLEPSLVTPKIKERLKKLNQEGERLLKKQPWWVRATVLLKRCFSPHSYKKDLLRLETACINNEANLSIPVKIPSYARAFFNDISISVACKELFKFIFVDIINPKTIDSIQSLGQFVEKKGKLTNKLKEFNISHFGDDTTHHLGCRGSAHSSNKNDRWQTIKITAPHITALGKTSPILLELKQNLDKHYHLKSGGGGDWNHWLNLNFEDKMKQNKKDPVCFNQNNTIMAPQLMLTLIDFRKVLGLIKNDKEYITALEQAYQ